MLMSNASFPFFSQTVRDTFDLAVIVLRRELSRGPPEFRPLHMLEFECLHAVDPVQDLI